MTALKLKPCPFCGGEAEIWRAHEGRTAWIACMGKCVVLISKEYLSNDEAIAAWNRRADLAAVPAQDECGHPFCGAKCGTGPVLTLEPQPDPRDEVIARLVGALLEKANRNGENLDAWHDGYRNGLLTAIDMTLAAAKAVL